MAGAKPEYFPVILAIGSTGMTGINFSDSGFMQGAVVNGPIRDEIKLNYEIGAVGPYAHAHTTIGRAWKLREGRYNLHGHGRQCPQCD
jgi:hypothetical protein